MKILVTGAAGFIGSFLTKKLLAANHLVYGLDDLNPYYNPALKKARLEKLIGKNKNFRFFKTSINNKKAVQKIFSRQKFDFLIHLAAQAGVRYSLTNPFIYEQTNVKGLLNILEVLKNSRCKLIFASSSSVYGNNQKIPFKETDPVENQASLYGVTKRSGELMVKTYTYLFGLQAVCCRFFTVYGPWGRPDMAYFSFTEKLLTGKPISVYQKDTSRDFTYIDDVILALEKILTKKFNFEIINLGNSHPVKLDYFLKTLEKITGKKANVVLQKLPLGDVKKTFADTSKAQKWLKWQSETKIEQGLQNFVSWYKKFRAGQFLA